MARLNRSQIFKIALVSILTIVFVYLAFLSVGEIGKKKRDEQRVAAMLKIQSAIDQYQADHQVFPFGSEQNQPNYQTLVQKYLPSLGQIRYDPLPNWQGANQDQPECYQTTAGHCYGRYVFDEKANSWYMQIRLERKTIFNGACSFPIATDRYCIGSQRLDHPHP